MMEPQSCTEEVVDQLLPHDSDALVPSKLSNTTDQLPEQSSSNQMSESMKAFILSNTGGHVVVGGKFTGCKMVTFGNTSSGAGHNPTLNTSLTPSHYFKDLTLNKMDGLHIGNTGPGSKGHQVVNPVVEECNGIVLGDFGNAEVKLEYMQKCLDLTNSTKG